MKKLKKTLSLTLALVMCVTVLPMNVLAAKEFEIKDGMLTDYYGSGGHIIIPDGVEKVSFGSNPTRNATITGLTIPGSVREIWGSLGQTSITDLDVPGTVVEIRGFSGSKSLASINIEDGVEKIGHQAFYNCTALTSLTLGKGLKKLGQEAFANCTALTSVTIPGSVTEFDSSVFRSCTSLESVVFSPGVTDVGAWMFEYCDSLTKVTLPESIVKIHPCAFSACTSLAEITLPNHVTQIGLGAFQDCTSLSSITLPASISSIEEDAFKGCTGLKDVYYGGTREAWEKVSILAGNDVIMHRNTDYEYGHSPEAGGAVIHFAGEFPVPDVPAPPAAQPTNDALTCDGEIQNPTVYKINDSNYFKIRDLAAILNGTEKQFSVGYDSEKQSVTAATGEGYDKLDTDLAGAPAGAAQAEISNDAIYVNGEKVEAEVYKINGNNYFKLRDLGKALNFYVGWTQETGMFIETDKPYSE